MRLVRTIFAALLVAVATIALHASPVFAQWPTTCVDLNDIVETHLGNHHNAGIYQRVFGDQAEQACQNDHRDDVRGVFAWAFDDSAQATAAATPELAWPTDCVELNDIVENHLGNHHNVTIYQRVFGSQAELACRNDHRADVRGVFAWAFGRTPVSVVPPVAATVPARIAFGSDRDGDLDIYVMQADGTGLVQLTDHPGDAGFPAWSPDGRRIAFGSGRDGDFDIYVMQADGTGLVQLTDHPGRDGWPAWSPDGRRIAFDSDRDGDRDIYVMQADGTGLVQLTDHPGGDGWPAWSPDGRRIAFGSDRDGDWDIYVMQADGTGLVQLTDHPGRDGWPAWSPDGRRIAFDSDRDGDWDIYVMQADGTGLVQLTDHPGDDLLPAWSPGG